MRVILQRAEGKVPGQHVAVTLSPEQALTAALFAVVYLHNVRCRLLMPVAVRHMHIVVDKLDAGKNTVE